MNRVFSAIQPTGLLHLGNYLGALKQFSSLQEKYDDCMYCVADLHAITVKQDPQKLEENILLAIAAFMASGVNPEKSKLFVQSNIAEHSELAWILACNIPLSWLMRMTQFKDKANFNENTSLQKNQTIITGLLTYPCLMSADILLYQANFIPIGEDQLQHLELASDIAKKFNHDFNTKFFVIPKKIIMNNSKRIMSLRDATKKMSKSEESDYSRINLTDSADIIAKKIAKAKTDEFLFPMTEEEAQKRLEINNLINIYSSCTQTSREEIINSYASSKLSEFKKNLIEVLVQTICPIGNKIQELLTDKSHLKQIVSQGYNKVKATAYKNIQKIKSIIGIN